MAIKKLDLTDKIKDGQVPKKSTEYRDTEPQKVDNRINKGKTPFDKAEAKRKKRAEIIQMTEEKASLNIAGRRTLKKRCALNPQQYCQESDCANWHEGKCLVIAERKKNLGIGE